MGNPIGNQDEKIGLATNSQTTRNDIGVGTGIFQANSTALIPPGGAPIKSPA